MFVLAIQTVLLLAIAFILGCILGCLLRRWFGSAEAETPVAAAGVAAVAAKKAVPEMPKPPMPAAPKPAPVAAPRAAASKPTPTPVAPLVSKPAPKAATRAKSPKKPTAPKPAAPKASVAAKDNLKLIRGIGPQNESRLNGLGVFRFDQIADWKAKDEAHFGDVLAFPGRIEREEWVKQAKVLAKGGTTEFAGRVKSGAVSSSAGKADAGDIGTKPKTLSKARNGKADNLTLIDGVGNAIESKMFKLGIYHFDQVAGMNKAELTWLGNAVGFPGRPERENWAGESKILAKGGTTEHAKRVERGQIKTSRKS